MNGSRGTPTRLDRDRPARVMIVEDHELLAQSLALALGAEGGLEVSRCADLRPQAVLEAVRTARPELVLLDLDLGDHGSSRPLIADIRASGSLVVMLTAVDDRARLAACIEAGAAGVVSKAEPFVRLVEAVTKVLRQHDLLSFDERREVLAALQRHRAAEEARLGNFARLSEREGEVLQGLIDGRSAEQIAEAAYVSVATVRTQIRSILSKLGVHSQLAAVALARRAEWSPDQR